MRSGFLAVAALLALQTGVVFAQANKNASVPCDRACLEDFVDQFLEAVIAHDPSRLPLTNIVRFTENGVKLELGDGLWRTMVGKGTYRFYVPDIQTQQVAFIGTLREESRTPGESTPVAIALRLRLEERHISEIETLVVREERAAQNIEKLGSPHPVFMQTIPVAERASRQDLVRVANMYFAGLELNDGKGEYPFTDDCNRIENGTQTTNAPLKEGQPRPDPATATSYSSAWGCKEQFESGLIHFVNRIRDRRFVAVDRERGIVFSFAFFDHSGGDTRTFQTPDGRTVTAGPTTPWTWQLAELFKIEKGLIRQVEAVLQQCPYGMNSGWSTWEEGMSSRARDIN